MPKVNENITILDTSVVENCAVRYNRNVFKYARISGQCPRGGVCSITIDFASKAQKACKSVSQVEFETPLVCANYRTKSLFFSLPEDVLNKIPSENVFAAILGVRNVCVELVAPSRFVLERTYRVR